MVLNLLGTIPRYLKSTSILRLFQPYISHCKRLMNMEAGETSLTTLNVFEGKLDRYHGVTVSADNITLDNIQFENKLKDSLIQWQISGKKAVWFKIPLARSVYVPLLAQNGFEFHHAKKEYVMMAKWLKTSPNTLPPYPFTFIGVAGLAVNENGEVLAVQEKYHVQKFWKLPGGYANPNEEFGETAIREVYEETGIKTEFVSILALRHHHKFQFGCSDIYIVCHLKPLNLQIKQCEHEIFDCKWMKIDEFKKHEEVSKLNRLFIEAYENSQRNKVAIGHSEVFSPFTKQNQTVYHIK